MGPLGIALFMWIVREPGRAAQLGLLGTKANLVGPRGDVAGVPRRCSRSIVGIGGMLLLAFIVAYVFGREYDDATAKNMLALPVGAPLVRDREARRRRGLVGRARRRVLAEAFVDRARAGPAGVLGGAGGERRRATRCSRPAISYLLVPVVAWITVWARGNMAPIGVRDRDAGARQPVRQDRLGRVVPVVDRAAADRHGGRPGQTLPAGSYVVVALTFVVGVAGTIGTSGGRTTRSRARRRPRRVGTEHTEHHPRIHAERRRPMAGFAKYPVTSVLRAEDLERAKRFYTDVMGFAVDEQYSMPGVVMLRAGRDTMLTVYERPGMPAPAEHDAGYSRFPPRTSTAASSICAARASLSRTTTSPRWS